MSLSAIFNHQSVRITLAMMMTGFLGACSPSKSSSPSWFQGLVDDMTSIVSTRPQNQGTVLTMVQLKQPALLSQIKTVNGARAVDSALAAEIEKEQLAMIAQLAKISSDIKVVYKYRMVLNALAITLPAELLNQVRALTAVRSVELSQSFGRPEVIVKHDDQIRSALKEDLKQKNSVKFIGAEDLYSLGYTGRGIKVGIIDTGIDYTHAMLGGEGTVAAYKAIDPAKSSSSFPNKKVVGGIDLVGTSFDSNSNEWKNRLPAPDANPLDEGGHGSHVAGTVAGLGDGVTTYSGVAPEAVLYAIKVFGAKGSTSDEVVIAALEYAANTKQDGNLDSQLDVVNLSLGSGFGNPHILYAEAIKNLSRSGTSVVISAGNSGDVDYIVGAPGTSDDAISVAASIDDADHNWKFPAVKFTNAQGQERTAEAKEASVSKPISQAGAVSGALVYAGLAIDDFSSELAAQVKGHVAFIDRGKVNFSEKIRRAEAAGAIGVVVANNAPGEAFTMGGDGHYAIPAVMITLDLANQLKAEMKSGDVKIDFQTTSVIEKPELIDTITGFSSKGPRSIDGALKPEISAPGSDIISAAMGGGAASATMSGTSMAAPHMAGVMALLKQARPQLSSAELKSAVMGSAKTIFEKQNQRYPLSRMGAGRVRVGEAQKIDIVSEPASLSLGLVNVQSKKVVPFSFRLKNLKATARDLQLSIEEAAVGLTLKSASKISVAASESVEVVVKLGLDFSANTESTELDGFLVVKDNGQTVLRIPVLAVAQHISQMFAGDLKTHSTSTADSVGAWTELELKNASSAADGNAYLFNLLGQDGRKIMSGLSPYLSDSCDLESVGYRFIRRGSEDYLQFAIKVYKPVTSWNLCEPSVLIDSDGDGEADQELAGMAGGAVPGIQIANKGPYLSYLLDANKARAVRKAFEASVLGPQIIAEDYTSALIAASTMVVFENSTIAILEVQASKLATRADGQLSVKVLTSHYESAASEVDNYLAKWIKLSLKSEDQAFTQMPEVVSVKAGQTQTVDLKKGFGAESLLVLFPENSRSLSNTVRDQQSFILQSRFEP